MAIGRELRLLSDWPVLIYRALTQTMLHSDSNDLIIACICHSMLQYSGHKLYSGTVE